MSAQYIVTTYKLSRRFPPDREVLTDISLSFLPGAKIGPLDVLRNGKPCSRWGNRRSKPAAECAQTLKRAYLAASRRSSQCECA